MLDPDMFENSDANIYPIRFTRIWSADFVGDPAATRGGLFSKNANLQGVPKMASETEKPIELAEAVDTVAVDEVQPEAVAAETEPAQPEALAEIVTVNDLRDDAQPYVDAFGNQGAAWFLEGKSLQECYQAENETLKETLIELHSQIEELVQSLAKFEDDNGEVEPLSVSPEVSKETQKQAAKREQIEQLQKKGASKPVVAWSALYNN